jgi:hypothetical protein
MMLLDKIRTIPPTTRNNESMESEVANTLPARHDSIFRHIGKRINEIKRAKASGIRTDLAKISTAKKANRVAST